MTQKPDNSPAFPHWSHGGGMSLRDYFAAAALQGFCAFRANSGEDFDPLECAEDSYMMADAMLKAREATHD